MIMIGWGKCWKRQNTIFQNPLTTNYRNCRNAGIWTSPACCYHSSRSNKGSPMADITQKFEFQELLRDAVEYRVLRGIMDARRTTEMDKVRAKLGITRDTVTAST